MTVAASPGQDAPSIPGALMLTRPGAATVGRASANGTASPRRLFDTYGPHPAAWDELFARPGEAHEHCCALIQRLGQFGIDEFQQRRAGADLVFINQGITFSVYSDR